MSSNPLTSDDLFRCRRVLDEALAADKLDSAQYRTRIRALVVAVNRDDLNALTRDLVPAVGEPGFIDEGHEVPTVLSSTPAAAAPRVHNDTTRAVPAAAPTPEPAPVDSFPSFPDEPDEDDDVEDDALPGGPDDAFPAEDDVFPAGDDVFPAGDDVFPGEDDVFPAEDDAFPGEEDPQPAGNAQETDPEIPEEDDQSVTRLVPAIRDDAARSPETITPPALPASPAGPVPGELVPVRQWSAEVSPVERASSSASTELSPLEHRSTEVSPLEPAPGTALPPAESDDDGSDEDESVNRVVVVMVPSAPSPSEPGVTGTSWDALSRDVPEPVGEPAQATPATTGPDPEVDEEDEEETVTRISSPIRFDDSEAPTQVLDAIKDLSIFREEPVGDVVEPPQPVLPYSPNQSFSGTPTDPTAQAAPTGSAGQAGVRMPPPMPEPSEATLAAMPPPTVPPAAGPPQGPWGSYGQDPLAAMPPPPDPSATAPPPAGEAAYHGYQQFHGQYVPGPVPPSDVPYQPPAYGAEPVPQQTPRRRSAWPWVIVTVMVLALLAWIAYLLFLSPQGRRSAAESTSRIQVTAAMQDDPLSWAGTATTDG